MVPSGWSLTARFITTSKYATTSGKGHRFRTHSDTETLLHLYEEEGVEGVSRLRGMFAYSIWDSSRKSIFLVRDRFGKKPLYYAVLPEGSILGARSNACVEAGVPSEIDAKLPALFQFNPTFPIPDGVLTAGAQASAGILADATRQGKVETGPLLEAAVYMTEKSRAVSPKTRLAGKLPEKLR